MSDSTTVRAERDAKYYRRFWYMIIGATIFLLLCLKDGFISYPARLEAQEAREAAFEEFKEERRTEKEWIAHAEKNGWPIGPPSHEEHMDQGKINGQFYMAGVCGVIVLGLLIHILRSLGTWIEGDGKSITSSWGQTVPFDQVTQLDKKKWKNKGIAKVQYTDNGKKKTFVIDDFKFLREPTGDILRQLEGSIDHGKIVNGKPEGPKEAKPEPSDQPAVAEPAT